VIIGRSLALAACGIAALAASSAAVPQVRSSDVAPTPLHARARASVTEFARWLDRDRARGLIGEVGWPGEATAGGDARWNDVARDWYEQAATAGLWVAAWATGEIWSSSYKLLAYAAPTQYGAVGLAHPQAEVIETRPSWQQRGLNVEQGAFGEFGAGYDPVAATSPLHNHDPGEYGSTYTYPGAATFTYLRSRGIGFVRVPFRWERLQREPGAELDPAELRRLTASVRAAGWAGLRVILDCHNYGAYYLFDGVTGRRRSIGSPAVSTGDFANLWRRLSQAFARDPAVLGYGLMNEPVGMRSAASWERASQSAVRAIRSTGDSKRVFVSSYEWGGTSQFSRNHSRGPWIKDPARNSWYEAHVYFDSDHSGRYTASYDEELRRARAGL
jgi:hypothetical protein